MKNKGFRLTSVLNYRKEMEKLRKLELAEARQELEKACSKLKSEEEKAASIDSELMERQQEGMTAQELELYSSFLRRKRMDIKNQRSNVGLLNREVGKRRETLLDASKGKKMLETLEKKSSDAVNREIADKEKELMEEIALRGKH